MSTESRLSNVYEEAERIQVDDSSKIVLMSDCHRGVGNWGDNFLNNQNVFFAALRYYEKNEFTYIELGDGDELWENRSLKNIIQTHSNVFWLISRLYEKGQFHMLYGNHDRKKQSKRYMASQCEKYYCDSIGCHEPLCPKLIAKEGIVLENKENEYEVLLTHGHQGEVLNDTLWYLSRFFVRYVWRRLELAGFHDPTSTAKNHGKQKRRERELAKWAIKNRVMLIAGHTHRPVLPEPGYGLYANDGSCVHPRCITAIEIEEGNITLVKWSVRTNPERILYVGREKLQGPHRLSEYFLEKPTENMLP